MIKIIISFSVILLMNVGLYAQNCDNELYEQRYRDHRTLYVDLETETLNENESDSVNALILKQFRRLPNNMLLNTNDEKVKKKMKKLKPDRIVSGVISKSIVEKDKYVGQTGKDQYLIERVKITYFKIEIKLLETSSSNVIYSYKKTINKNDISEMAEEIYTEISPYYKDPHQACVKKEIPVKKEYFISIYGLYGFPINDYSDFLSNSYGAGLTFGIKGIATENFIISLNIECAYNSTDNPDINYAITVNGGIGIGYNFKFNIINIIPELGFGYIYSFYNVKYDDMDTFYRNIKLHSAIEINTEILSRQFFIKPQFSSILENDNILSSIDFLIGVKIKL